MSAPKKRAREGSVYDAESMGAPGRSTNASADPMAVLGDAGMVLRDPATMRLIIHHVNALGLLTAHCKGSSLPGELYRNIRDFFISCPLTYVGHDHGANAENTSCSVLADVLAGRHRC